MDEKSAGKNGGGSLWFAILLMLAVVPSCTSHARPSSSNPSTPAAAVATSDRSRAAAQSTAVTPPMSALGASYGWAHLVNELGLNQTQEQQLLPLMTDFRDRYNARRLEYIKADRALMSEYRAAHPDAQVKPAPGASGPVAPGMMRVTPELMQKRKALMESYHRDSAADRQATLSKVAFLSKEQRVRLNRKMASRRFWHSTADHSGKIPMRFRAAAPPASPAPAATPVKSGGK